MVFNFDSINGIMKELECADKVNLKAKLEKRGQLDALYYKNSNELLVAYPDEKKDGTTYFCLYD